MEKETARLPLSYVRHPVLAPDYSNQILLFQPFLFHAKAHRLDYRRKFQRVTPTTLFNIVKGVGMELEEIQLNDVVVMILTGKMDANTVAVFNQRHATRIEEGKKLFVVDMDGVSYISSAGLRGILTAVKKCEAIGGRLLLNGLNGMVHDAFQLSGFLRYFETFANREEAVNAARGR